MAKWKSDPTIWKTEDGRLIPIVQLENDHLLNTIKFLNKRLGEGRAKKWELYQNLISEAVKRNLSDNLGWDT